MIWNISGVISVIYYERYFVLGKRLITSNIQVLGYLLLKRFFYGNYHSLKMNFKMSALKKIMFQLSNKNPAIFIKLKSERFVSDIKING